MKKIITLVLSVILILGSALFFSGCETNKNIKYIVQYMDAIPITFSGYQMAVCGRDEETCIEWNTEQIGTLSIGNEIKDYRIYNNENRERCLNIDGTVIVINQEFMTEKSTEYRMMNEMWEHHEPKLHTQIDRHTVIVYDNNIFIVTCLFGSSLMFIHSFYGDIPYAFYKLDYKTMSVLYAGYMRDIRSFSANQKIVKLEEK